MSDLKEILAIEAEARRLERERIIALLTGDRLRVQIDSPMGWATVISEGILREELRPF